LLERGRLYGNASPDGDLPKHAFFIAKVLLEFLLILVDLIEFILLWGKLPQIAQRLQKWMRMLMMVRMVVMLSRKLVQPVVAVKGHI